MAKVST